MAKTAALRDKTDPVILSSVTRDRLLKAIDEGRIFRPYAYQAERLMSRSKYNLDLWSRQTGKSQTNAQDSVNLAAETSQSVMCLSASQDLTKELMVKVAIYAEVLFGVAGEIQRAVSNGELDDLLYVDADGVRITQSTITLPSGERIIGRPANPRTARGFSMHVKLDEFGMHKDQDEIWAAAYPSITSREIFRMDVMSTPGLRTDDKFASLCQKALRGENDFAFRKVNIYDAVRAGYPADIEKLKRNLADEDRWRREYLCEFVDEAGAFLTYDMIRGCGHEGIKLELPPAPDDWDEATLGWDPAAGDVYVGVDIGRRKDLTVFWILQQIGDVLWTRGVMRFRNTPFARQMEIGKTLFSRLPVRRVAVDATGMGMMLAEEWQVLFGSWKVEALTYTNALKSSLAEGLKPFFDDRRIRIPIDSSIQEALHSVQKLVTTAGNIRFAGERTPDGHADEFWALANAVHCVTANTMVGGLIVL